MPDLMIEIISPSNTASEVMQKVNDYFRAGARLIWVVYPIEESVQVYNPDGNSRVLGRGDTLDGADVLPGFRLPVATLFEDEPKATDPRA